MGQKSMYRFLSPVGAGAIVAEVLARGGEEIAECEQDDAGLKIVLNKRKDHLRGYFDELAGRFGRNYVPGRSWKALTELLIRLLPPQDVADIGAGEGTLAMMFAQRANSVIAIDSSQKMVEYGAGLALKHGIENLDFRLGDMEELPIKDDTVDLVMFHQSLHHAIHPVNALEEGLRILRPGGQIVILDLVRHDIEAARELYADVWLGFSQVEISAMLQAVGFADLDVSIVDRAVEPPHFEALMAIARKP